MTMKSVFGARLENATDLLAALAELDVDDDMPVFVGDREVCGVELQEGDHPTLGKVRNVVLTLGPRPGHTD